MGQHHSVAGEIILIILCFFCTLALTVAASLLTASDPLFQAMIKFARESELITTQYLTDLPPEEVFRSGWRGMQQAIPFRVELSEVTETSPNNQKTDFGVTIVAHNGMPTVYSVHKESSLFGLLLPADVLKQVGDLPGEELENFAAYMESNVNRRVTFLYERDGKSDSAATVLRALPRQGIQALETVDGVCYISIESFVAGLAEELADSLKDVPDNSVRSMVIDLRKTDNGSAGEADRLAELFEIEGKPSQSRFHELPLMLIIGTSTRGEAELFCRRLVNNHRAKTAGGPTLGLARQRTAIELTLFRETLFVYRDVGSGPRLDTSLAMRGKGFPGIVPDIPLEQKPLSPITDDMLTQELLFDFVVHSSYDSLPGVAEEEEIFETFIDFIRTQGSFTHPFKELNAELSAFQTRPDATSLLERMQEVDSVERERLLQINRAEIIEQLLSTILDVRLGRNGTVAEKIRCGDTVLEQALALVRSREL